MDELERQEAEIIARQSRVPVETPYLHPNIASIYRKRVERFTDALHNDNDGRIAAEQLRSLVEEVVLMPGEKRGEVHAGMCLVKDCSLSLKLDLHSRTTEVTRERSAA